MTTLLNPRELPAQAAAAWGHTALEVLNTPFPWMSQHASAGVDDCDVTPWTLHPAFHACLDWHSSCHMQASAVVLLTDHRDHLVDGDAEALERELDERLTPEHAAVEARYLREHPSFERPYGWAWVVVLAAVTSQSAHPSAPRWARASLEVADAAMANLLAWLPKLVHPVRTGQHDNTAFSLLLAREAAVVLGRADVVDAVDDHARRLFLADVDYPSHYEPSGNDFLSAALVEAELMRAVLGDDFDVWLVAFLPRLGESDDELLRTPEVRDLSDGKLVHLFGLALSRARGLRVLAAHVDDVRATRMRDAADAQFAAAAAQIDSGHFMSTHWLVTFALRALTP